MNANDLLIPQFRTRNHVEVVVPEAAGMIRVEVKGRAVEGECRTSIVARRVDDRSQVHGRGPRVGRGCARRHPQVKTTKASWAIGGKKHFHSVSADGRLSVTIRRAQFGDKRGITKGPIGLKGAGIDIVAVAAWFIGERAGATRPVRVKIQRDHSCGVILENLRVCIVCAGVDIAAEILRKLPARATPS